MNEPFRLDEYLEKGIESLISQAVKTTLANPSQSLFLARFALSSRKAGRLRLQRMKQGEHIPPFLIASITKTCNLQCAGCYDRHNQNKASDSNSCLDVATTTESMLTTEDWQRIFEEARSLGVVFILLAGGEPLLRPEILQLAGRFPEILFPVFTNGTLVDEVYLQLFARYRNLIPIVSIEGDRQQTDKRRGNRVYERLESAMRQLNERHILYGASVTVTTANLHSVTSGRFLNELTGNGCRLVFYVEYVPTDPDTVRLAPGDQERQELADRLMELRTQYTNMIFISFPGDEMESGGCLAAGRGFFHISANGNAEPCPFSPYSDTSLRQTSLREALQSPLFLKLRSGDILMDEHRGGCVLFEQEELVQSLLQSEG